MGIQQRKLLRYYKTENSSIIPLLLIVFLVQVCYLFNVEAITLPSGFQESVVFSGLTKPTAVRFAADGRVFVAEKSGIIKVFNGLTDTTPDIFADLRTNVYDYWDRGLLGMTLDPAFPTRPYVYVLYAYDFDPFFTGPQPPRWGDTCPNPPGDTADGCVINARASRLEISPTNMLVGGEQVLLQNNWCQQYPSHSIGTLMFGAEGALYVSAGDGASFGFTDYGQGGGSSGSPTPKNPCGDPPVARGTAQVPPTAEGGALRSQDIRTTTDPLTYDGAVLRINPDTGGAWPTNFLIGGDPADDRIIAYGLRNPFRFTIRPNTSEVWVGDVGWSTFEEINRIPNPNTSVRNFGWPCYEGSGTQSGYDGANLNLCENLYTAGTATAPYYAYNHNSDVDPAGDACPTGGSSISGLAFYPGGVYPSQYQNALFFADFSRKCIYVMRKGTNGDPDINTRTAFAVNAGSPVDIEIGPGGDLFYADHTGSIRRIVYFAANQPPEAVIQANPTFGNPPLAVFFDGSASSDPDPGATLFYKWDLDGDSQFDDSTLVNPSYTYTSSGQYLAKLQVTDDDGATSTDQIVITVGNTPPTASILAPSPTFLWKVGDEIVFSGEGNDPEQGKLSASRMRWEIILHHCPAGIANLCHEHSVAQYSGISGGKFIAPDHEWDAYLEFILTVTDSGGLTDDTSVPIDPQTVTLNFSTSPTSLNLAVGGVQETAPFSRPAIIGSRNSVSAVTPQTLNSYQYNWVSWSDGGAQSHEITAGLTSANYGATYRAQCIFSVSPTSQTFSHLGGTGTVSVTAPAGCSWTASSNVSWITITSGTSGNGNGVVRYSVAANTATTKRTGILTVAGISVSITEGARKKKN